MDGIGVRLLEDRLAKADDAMIARVEARRSVLRRDRRDRDQASACVSWIRSHVHMLFFQGKARPR